MAKPAPPLTFLHAHASALAVGAMLGWLVWELSRLPDRPLFNLAMGLLLIGSGCASFVLYRLHLRSRRPHATRSALASEARACVTWLSCGVLIALQALPLVLA